MSRFGVADSRIFTDYRQNCVREKYIRDTISTQLKLKVDDDSASNLSVENMNFLVQNSQVIRDTDRNKTFGQFL